MSSKFFHFLIVLTFTSRPATAQKFLPDDPILVDKDSEIDAREPRTVRLSDYYDFLENTFSPPWERLLKPAASANSLGDVPDSSWFQNRHGRLRMTKEELAQGPNSGKGPADGEPWVVIQGKSEGITPGFRIRDSLGDSYVIKFDPLTNPEMATSSEIISTRFFYAMGYYVPENYLVFFRRDQLRVDPAAEISVGLGPPRQMTERDLDDLLLRVSRTSDIRFRAVASKLIEGRPIGPFKYFGTRRDDPNDVIPHEERRELRGLRVFSSWLNHDDSRAVNTLDTVITRDGRRFVRHYLIDFGSTLGSGSVQAQKPRAGWEYLWQPRAVIRRTVTLGLWDSPWIRVRYPNLPSIGRFESKVFTPQDWRPEYPNAAFENSLPDDDYWAARIVMAFTDEDIAAIVRAGGLTDSQEEQYLIQSLIERRDKIGRYYFNRVLSIDNFTLNADTVRFEYLPERFDFAKQPDGYVLQWFRFDNRKNEKMFVGKEIPATGLSFQIPTDLLNESAPYFGVEVREKKSAARGQGDAKVSVFMSRLSSLRIVGIDRSWNVE